MNMFKSVKAKSIKEYFDMLPEERRAPIEFLHKFIQKVSPKLKPRFMYNMPGYGIFKHRNYKNEIIEWPVVALASQKNYISIYICAINKGRYVAEMHKRELGKVSVGKSCIRFRKLDDVNLKTLQKVMQFAQKFPGLEGASKYRDTK